MMICAACNADMKDINVHALQQEASHTREATVHACKLTTLE